MSLEV